MEVDLIFKIAGIGIIVAILNILLQRSGRDEQAMMTTIAGLLVVMMMLVGKIALGDAKVIKYYRFNILTVEATQNVCLVVDFENVLCLLKREVLAPEFSFV